MEKGSEKILLVVDSSILFSYFMLSRKIRNIVLNSNVTLYTPDWAINELNKYFDNKIAKRVEKKGISREEIELIVLDLMQRLIVVPKTLYIDKWNDALKIAEQFDVKDAPFIALALKLSIPIWTGDRRIIEFGLKTGRYVALDTKAVEDLIKGENLKDVLDDLRRRFEL
ncbi:PIN domain-containing protein [Archaeoglobus sp.]